MKFSFGNPTVFENFGFNVNVRWNDEYLWESTFADAIIDASGLLTGSYRTTYLGIRGHEIS